MDILDLGSNEYEGLPGTLIKNGRLADVGCGEGLSCRVLAGAFPSARWVKYQHVATNYSNFGIV